MKDINVNNRAKRKGLKILLISAGASVLAFGVVMPTVSCSPATKEITINWHKYDGTKIGSTKKSFNIDSQIDGTSYPAGQTIDGVTFLDVNDPALKPADTVQYIFSFDSWEGLPLTVTKDTASEISTYAVYKNNDNKHVVTFDAGIGEFESGKKKVEIKNLIYGTKASDVKVALTDNPKESVIIDGVTYLFKGWSPEIVDVTNDVTYLAQYVSDKEFTVKWYNDLDETKDPLLIKEYQAGTIPTYNGNNPRKVLESEKHTHTCVWSGWLEEITPLIANTNYHAKFTDDISFKFIGEGCTINGKSSFSDLINYGSTQTEYTIIPDSDKVLPNSIVVTLEDEEIPTSDDFVYQKDTSTGTAKLTLKHSECNFTVKVTC